MLNSGNRPAVIRVAPAVILSPAKSGEESKTITPQDWIVRFAQYDIVFSCD
ncbi:MAG: hypothetical protein HGB36_01630 [Chlorobiaceae bacterium]|jgi:hypothetical protein|nr:hypothetical protein [Chlorobiaceae bacterium]